MQKQSFGEALREAREAQGVSMRGLATAADMDPAYLSRLENGKTGEPRQETVEKLAIGLCDEAGLPAEECGTLKRRLLVAAGHLQPKEDLLDDLADRFAARLRDAGWPESKIDETLARVPLATMRAVLLGEEPLEVGFAADYSAAEVEERLAQGEDVLGFSLSADEAISEPLQEAMSLRERRRARKPTMRKTATGDSAASYLDKHATEFATSRRIRREQSLPKPPRVIRAGSHAAIHVEKDITRDQENQLRLLARLIASLLQENK